MTNSPMNENGLPEYIINQGYFSRFFQVIEKLGRGSAGSVYLCKHILNDVVLGLYAVKIVPIGNDTKWLNRVLREVGLLEQLHHENVIDYKHTWIEIFQLSTFGIPVPCLFILMEYANAGNLETFIKDNLYSTCDHKQALVPFTGQLRGLGEERLLNYAKTVQNVSIQICRGIQHLHELSIIHHDLKPQNILLKYANSSQTVLLSDFGECELLSSIGSRERTGATGTLEFMAPELLTSNELGHYGTAYDCSSDIWSFGLVLFYICYGKSLFDADLSKEELVRQIIEFDPEKLQFPNENPYLKPFEIIIIECLQPNPKNRPSADRILKMLSRIHPSYQAKNHQNEIFGKNWKKIVISLSIFIYLAWKISKSMYFEAAIVVVIIASIGVFH